MIESDGMGKQLSIFDIELPDASTQKNDFKMAELDNSEIKSGFDVNVPTITEILKRLENFSLRVGRHELLSDVFECGAIAVSNKFSYSQLRENRYIDIMKKYDECTRKQIVDLFCDIYLLLSNQFDPNVGFNDYLGELYMKSETSSKQSGQFFTPYNLSKLCAEAAICEDQVRKAIDNDEILTLHEPTCGAGGMVIAAADILYNKFNFNYSRNLLVECWDIDTRCVHMTYLQLGLAGIPAVVYHRDGLSLKTWDRWETPAYIMQWIRFRNKLQFVGTFDGRKGD